MEDDVKDEIKEEGGQGGENEKGGVPAAAVSEAPESAGTELTDEEKRLVRNYAVNDPEVRRVIVSDYISRLKSADHVPEVMQGSAGASPVFVPRAARDMREAAVLAEALLKRK